MRPLEAGSVEDHGSDDVGVDVRGWSSILDVALALIFQGLCRNPNGGSTIASTIGELVEGRGLVDARQPLIVVLAIELHMQHVLLLETLHHVLDVLHASGAFTHLLRREIGVAARAIPVREDLGLETHDKVVQLGNALEKVASGPHVIALLDADAWTDLELPLRGHDLTIGSRDLDAGVQAALVVLISYFPSEALVAANRTIVWTLSSRECVLRPLVRSVHEPALSI